MGSLFVLQGLEAILNQVGLQGCRALAVPARSRGGQQMWTGCALRSALDQAFPDSSEGREVLRDPSSSPPAQLGSAEHPHKDLKGLVCPMQQVGETEAW